VQLRFPVVLASGSPRRRELLADLVPDFEVLVSDVDEEPLPGEEPARLAERLALEKARAVSRQRPSCLVIGGDTVVAVRDREWQMLAKPQDDEDAVRMLKALSGRTHVVVTGLALVWPDGERSLSVETEVEFLSIPEKEIRAYVATGEPMDKAGAYAIQGGAAGWVTGLRGSKTNVIGLPMEALELELARLK
jgi:septum formation protein